MILKKPYAFLIKYFKLINIILAALTIYLAYRTYNIITFFSDYIGVRYSGNYYPGMSNNYISPIVYFTIFLILIGISVILFLFVYKKKPTKFYVLSAVYYLIFIVFLNLTKNVMLTIETSTITIENARLFNDLSVISIVPQIIIIIIFLLRGFGFQINQFNFEKDLKELEISSQDNEEVEFTIKGDGVKFKRMVRRYFREFGYYLKENKFMVIIVIISISLVTLSSIKKINSIKYEVTYNQNETIISNGYDYKILDSIVTNLDYNGNIINNNYYVVLKLEITNKKNDDINLDYNTYRLVVNDNYLYPLKDKELFFVDYAQTNNSDIVRTNSSIIKPLVYEIKKEDIKKNYILKIENGTLTNGKSQKNMFNYINITPVLLDTIITEKKVNLGEEIIFDKSNLDNTSFMVKNLLITDRYMYNYESCSNNNCQKFLDLVTIDSTKKDKVLMILNYSYNLDQSTPFAKTSSTINGFINFFVKIKYKINDEEKIVKCDGFTPNNLKNKLVIQTTSEIKESKELTLIITIRNKDYQIKLK